VQGPGSAVTNPVPGSCILRGGLAEVEVYQGDTNVALGAAATGDSSPEAVFRPDRLTDGNRGGKLDQEGIWLLINGKPGSALVDLNSR